VYDTRKDSDGGAWRKRTQNTSWYNETLNTATRGSRKDFPAVAVIVATTTAVTIYDGDDPDMPMWMVFQSSGYGMSGVYMFNAGNVVNSSIYALNGILVGGQYQGSDTYGSPIINFISEKVVRMDAGTSEGGLWLGNIADRNSGKGYASQASTGQGYVIIDSRINDVAMTVLPNAPIDTATGLPVPTIAVATNGGVSIIKDDGTVVNWLTNIGYTTQVSISKNYELFMGGGDGVAYYAWYNKLIPTTSSNNSDAIFGTSYSSTSLPRLGNNGNSVVGRKNVFSNDTIYFGEYAGSSTNDKLIILNQNTTHFGNSLVAYLTSSYNTGWMHGDIKGAWLSDTSTASVTGTALLTGQASTYSVDTSAGGWTAQASATAVYDASNGVGGTGCIKLTSTGGSNIYTTLSLGTVVSGSSYSLTFSAKTATAATSYFKVSSGANNGGTIYSQPDISVTTSHVTYSLIFTATSTTAWFSVFAGGGNSANLFLDNIDLRLLAEPDRSANAKGLAVYGTLTKTAVATGSNLVAYGGFTSSNYLLQPYNSTLAVGTGDICFMGWAKTTVSGYFELLFDYGLGLSNEFRVYFINDGTGILLQATANSFSTYDNVATTIGGITSWKHLTIIRRNLNNYQVYVNGVLVQNSTLSYFTTFSNSGNNSPLYFGNVSSGNPSNASMALWRISASVPSPTQIAKIYNDEKVLFQENSQCTLYGSSDAVTALAYDDTTKLLSVGTSSGRSDFQGLQRINNTTTAVTTAISASNGLIAEQ
jgi:hypothetical protein